MKLFNHTHRLLFLMAATLLLFSCGKDFLEEEPSGLISKKQISDISKLNPASTAGSINGIYAMTFEPGLAGWPSNADFGQKALDIASDILSGDISQLSHEYWLFQDVSDLSGTEITGPITEIAWKYYYKIIRGANEIIEMFDNEIPKSDKDKWTFGQAKALRGYAYLYLVNFYQNPYSDAKTKKSIILRDENNTTPGKLSTVEEVYKSLLEDLETAVVALEGFERPHKIAINQNVARGLLAYAYLFMEQYDKAEEIATKIINSKEFTLMSREEVVESGFRDIKIPGWMWGVEINPNNTPYLRSVFGTLDLFTYGFQAYTGFVMNKELYQEIPGTDIRKTQFCDTFYHVDGEDTVKYEDLYPIQKFYTTVKIPDYDKNWVADEAYMRIAEIYLIKAEAQARQGKEGEAKASLLELVSQRDTDGANRINPLSGNALLDEIYFQWRIEMWGEGKSLWAMKRFKKTNKRGSSSFRYAGEEFAYDDPRLVFDIPEVERNSNPNIGQED
ncbi:MAG: RagB/SusD family nutrient uptake outer membrane protein [Bacteroidia bacterium]|nr:MAG: RagB/SusD family nutrient uptake outer membrane protein [Bacteroidia bacterium]